MLFNLVKKDFLLIKKYIFFIMLFTIGFPIFISSRLPPILSSLIFIVTMTTTELVICQTLLTHEAKYPKAAALLCSVSYSRSAMVKAKYIFFLVFFIYCFAVNNLLALVFTSIGTVSLTSGLFILLAALLIYGTYLPFYFRYGLEKTKFFFMITIFSVSFGLPFIYKQFPSISLDFSAFASIPDFIKIIVLALASTLVLIVSITISNRIYSKIEL